MFSSNLCTHTQYVHVNVCVGMCAMCVSSIIELRAFRNFHYKING